MVKRATNKENAAPAARVDPASLTMADIFGPGGWLERAHETYEFRGSQL